jgi:hypothetical protein
MRFREWGETAFFERFVSQLRKIHSEGHEVGLHVHPHWELSTYREGKYHSNGAYSIADFNRARPAVTIESLLERSHSFLEAVIKEVDTEYRCTSFRSGYCMLEPESATILSVLRKLRIQTDSSIPKGFYLRSAVQDVDYRRTPAQTNWYLGEDGDLTKAGESGVVEVPIATVPRLRPSILAPLVLSKLSSGARTRARRYDNSGFGIPYTVNSVNQRLKNFFLSTEQVTFDTTHGSSFYDSALAEMVRAHRRTGAGMAKICVNAHPKFVGSHQLAMMQHFVRAARMRFPSCVEVRGLKTPVC